MRLQQTRLITADVPKLAHFYETLTQAAGSQLASGYVEFEEGPCRGLAIADVHGLATYGAGVVDAANNRSVVLDFEIEDLDAEYTRLCPLVGDWVQAPTLRPWGYRSMLFRDPDGNLINMFARSASSRASSG